VVFSPDLRRLAGVSAKTVKVWDARTRQALFTLKGHTNNVSCVAFSPDGKRLAGGDGLGSSLSLPSRPNAKSVPGVVKVWDAQTGRELLSLEGHPHRVVKVAFSPNGKRLASVSVDNTVKVWDAQTGRELFSITPKMARGGVYTGVAFSPDGKRLATGGTMWDVQSGQEVLPGVGIGLNGAFSPDGKRLAWALSGNSVQVWDAQTGKVLLTLTGGSVAFSPDGERLATAGEGQVKVWDVQTSQETLTLKAPTGPANVLAFSSDGHRLGLVTYAGQVTIWDATPLPEKP
jgi:WD40 repeat protein